MRWRTLHALLLVAATTLSTAVAVAEEASGPVQAELDELKVQSDAAVSPELLEAGKQGTAELARSGILKRALNKGASMPSFTLTDAHGQQVNSRDLLAKGPLVIIFYRGAWCPFCNLYLRAVQEYLPEIEAHGATLVAISGEPQDRSLTVEEKNALSFTVLSDPELVAARQFGIVYELPKVVDDAVMKVGFDMRQYYGTEKAELPLSATYVVDGNGKIVYAFLDVDYKKRAEPADILAALSGM